jgi:DNA-binding response OmpR family regulator
MQPKILLIEDEADLGNVVKQYLEVMDFEVDWCRDGKDAYDKCTNLSNHYNILLIDINLPGMDGITLASKIVKTRQYPPFLFLTARSEKTDRLRGLKIGADDYITKPFDIDELVLRIKNIIRRDLLSAPPSAGAIEIGNLVFHKESMKLLLDKEKEIMLTPRETELLDYLLSHANKVLKREEILRDLWGENDYFMGRSLDVFISRLRKYLAGNECISICNVYGVGFLVNVK